jgi:hypothetical protein
VVGDGWAIEEVFMTGRWALKVFFALFYHGFVLVKIESTCCSLNFLARKIGLVYVSALSLTGYYCRSSATPSLSSTTTTRLVLLTLSQRTSSTTTCTPRNTNTHISYQNS